MNRYNKGIEAKNFFLDFFYAEPYAKCIAIENPVPSKVFNLPNKTQVIQPYMFGDPYSQKTYLWLKNLPLLEPTDIVSDYKPYVSCGTSKNKGNKDKSGVSRAGGDKKVRSKTFPGIAAAMAHQWGDYLIGLEDNGDE